MKKIIALALVVVMLFTLVSCGLSRKPEALKEKLEKKFDDDVAVTLADDDLSIGIIAKSLGVDEDDITAIISISLDDVGDGFIIYCDSSKAAREVKDEFKDYIEEYELEDEDLVIKKSGKNVFFGEKDLWKKIKGV